VTDIMAEITAASLEQTAGIEQVNQAIGQMDQVTQQNAALVEEAAAASESMQDQAAKLAQVVSVFKVDGVQASPVIAAPTLEKRMASRHVVASVKKPVSLQGAHPDRHTQKRITSGGSNDEWEEF
jgi:methyl-accepting chemotaxis protein